jgi:hypothetical protein
MSREILTSMLVPVVTAVIGAIGILVRDRYERHSEAGRRKSAMEDATRQVTFATEWWKAKQAFGCSANDQAALATAESWLAEASTLVAESRRPPSKPKAEHSVIRRVLLAYRLRRGPAKVLRLAYYAYLACTAMTSFIFTRMAIAGVDIRQFELLPVATFVLYGLPAFAFRAWAVAVETRAAKQPAPVPTPEPVTRPTMLASDGSVDHRGWLSDPVGAEKRYWDGRQWRLSPSGGPVGSRPA